MFTDGKRFRIDCLWVCVALLALIGCRGRMVTSKTEWVSWFGTTAAKLPRWKWSEAATPEFVAARSPGGLVLRLPPDYRQRNSNCWNRHESSTRGSGARDVCVRRMVPQGYARLGFFLEPRAAEPGATDQYQYAAWEAGLVMFGGRRAIVERALVSGGVEGARQQRETSVMIEFHPGDWAILQGRSGDDLGYEEFLRIASTIELP
jgi:hypothetical protein